MTYTVYWIPNPPREPFKREVMSPAAGYDLLTALAAYDLYLGDDLISSNTGGLLDGAGEEWEYHGEDVWQYFEEHQP